MWILNEIFTFLCVVMPSTSRFFPQYDSLNHIYKHIKLYLYIYKPICFLKYNDSLSPLTQSTITRFTRNARVTRAIWFTRSTRTSRSTKSPDLPESPDPPEPPDSPDLPESVDVPEKNRFMKITNFSSTFLNFPQPLIKNLHSLLRSSLTSYFLICMFAFVVVLHGNREDEAKHNCTRHVAGWVSLSGIPQHVFATFMETQLAAVWVNILNRQSYY